MLKLIKQILAVPSPNIRREIDEAEMIKFNILYLLMIFINLIFHVMIAAIYESYSNSFVLKIIYAWCLIMIIQYFKSGKNGHKCFKTMTHWGVITCLVLGFDDFTYHLCIYSPILLNQWLTGLNQIKLSIAQSILNILLNTFYLIPNKIRIIEGIQDLEELRNMTIQNLTYMKYTFILCVFVSLIVLKISFSHIKDDEESIRREELEKRIKTQEHLILSFSHELNNPIHTIINNLYELKGLMQANPKALTIIKATKSSVSFLSCFVNNVLDISKIDKNNLELNPIHVKLKLFLNDLWENCSTIIESKQIKSKIKFMSTINSDSVYTFDPHRMRQIVYNIVNNSVKYTTEGKIKIYISTHSILTPNLIQSFSNKFGPKQSTQFFEQIDSQIELSEGSMSTKYLRLEIKDTGCGIEENKINSVFKKQEFENSSKNKNSQQKQQQLKLGVSLWLTQQIIKKLGGKIAVHSQLGKGTSVVVMIPIIQQNLFYDKEKKLLTQQDLLNSSKSDSRKNSIQQIKINALIVEDVPFNQNIVKNYLTKANVEVLDIAENGQIAIQKYKELVEKGIKIDMICMDIEMPIMNGKEATRGIREIEREKQLQETKIFFVSGNTIKKEIDECLDKNGEIRGDAFLKKPLQYDEFQTTINSFLLQCP